MNPSNGSKKFGDVPLLFSVLVLGILSLILTSLLSNHTQALQNPTTSNKYSSKFTPSESEVLSLQVGSEEIVVESSFPQMGPFQIYNQPESTTPQVDVLSGGNIVQVDITPTSSPFPTKTPIPIQPALLAGRSGPTNLSVGGPSPTEQPTLTPKPKPTVIKPTLSSQTTATPSAESITINLPTIHPSEKNSSSLNSDLILNLINSHRTKLGLGPFEKNDNLCRIANYRAPQLYNEIFITGKLHSGFYDLKLPYWITENMAHYPTEEKVFNWWLGSRIHRAAIEGDYKYSCGACLGNSCAQLFTNFTPK